MGGAGTETRTNYGCIALDPYRFKKRILIPLDFTFDPYLAEMEKAVDAMEKE